MHHRTCEPRINDSFYYSNSFYFLFVLDFPAIVESRFKEAFIQAWKNIGGHLLLNLLENYAKIPKMASNSGSATFASILKLVPNKFEVTSDPA